MTSPRVCHIVPGFCADEYDWCIPALRNFILAVARDNDTVVYTPHYPFRRSSYRVSGVVVHCLSNRKVQGAWRLLLWRELARRIAADHAREPFALIHSFWATETGFLGTMIARRLGIPSIVSIGGGELARQPQEQYGAQLHAVQRMFVRRSFRHASIITAGSRWVAAKAPEEYQKKIMVMPLGVNTDMFRPGELRVGLRLLASASMIALKDYPTILRAVAGVRRHLPGITLAIAGDGVERHRLERLTDELHLRDMVTFLGHVPYDGMPALYHSADLFLHGSLYESQCMVVLEALATGLPVVASNVGIAAELPESMVKRFKPGDASGLASAIINSLVSCSHAHAAHTAGPGLIRDAYSVERASAVAAGLYRRLRPDRVEFRSSVPQSKEKELQ